MNLAPCSHAAPYVTNERPYTGPVYTPGVTDENTAAHGGTTATLVCDSCGARCKCNYNGTHRERSAWKAPTS